MSINVNNIVEKFIDTEGYQLESEVLKSGHINDTILINLKSASENRQFIIQRLNPNIFKEPEKIMANIEIVAQHLEKKNYPRHILRCLKTKNGDFLVKDDNTQHGAWRMIPFFGNTYSVLKVENADQAFESATAFAEYAQFLSDIDIDKIQTILPNFHNAQFRIGQFQDALNSQPKEERLKNAHSALAFVKERLNKFSQSIEHLPLRVTHNDTKISNILFDAQTHKASCIIDLDTLQPDTILSDFGDMVRTYTPQYDEDEKDFEKVECRFDVLKAIVEGFSSKLKNILTDDEKKMLMFGAEKTIFIQALRFLTDYLNNDTYYKTYYSEHNLVRTENQIALLKSFEKQSDNIKKLFNLF